jgi:hypothetical protein
VLEAALSAQSQKNSSSGRLHSLHLLLLFGRWLAYVCNFNLESEQPSTLARQQQLQRPLYALLTSYTAGGVKAGTKYDPVKGTAVSWSQNIVCTCSKCSVADIKQGTWYQVGDRTLKFKKHSYCSGLLQPSNLAELGYGDWVVQTEDADRKLRNKKRAPRSNGL